MLLQDVSATMNYSSKTNTSLGTGVDPARQLATDGSDSRQEKQSPSTSRSGDTTRRNSDDPEVGDVDGQNGGGVNVEQAKRDFGALQRSISRQSSLARKKSRNSEKGQANFDPEKGGDHGEEFDLLEYLVSSQRQSSPNQTRSADLSWRFQSHSDLGSHPETGFKFKALGVSWYDHNVVGAGGIKLNIRTVSSSRECDLAGRAEQADTTVPRCLQRAPVQAHHAHPDEVAQIQAVP